MGRVLRWPLGLTVLCSCCSFNYSSLFAHARVNGSARDTIKACEKQSVNIIITYVLYVNVAQD